VAPLPPVHNFAENKSLILWNGLIAYLNAREDAVTRHCEIRGAALSPTLRQFLARECVRLFPDGSAQVDGIEHSWELYQLLMAYSQGGAEFRQSNTHFRSLASHPEHDYRLFTSEAYFEQLGGEQDLIVSPGLPDLKPGEEHPEDLLVRVRFWGGLPKDSRPKFFKAMVAWQDSVAERGIWGSGPALLFPDSFLFSRAWASFRVDVSRTTQDTINWLTLCIVNFAAEDTPVSWIRYADPEDASEY